MDDLVKYGLLGAGDQKDAALMALFNLGAQIGNRSAPRLTPTPPPLDMSKVMGVYQNTLTNAMKRRALVKELEDREKRRSFFDAKAIDPVAASQIAMRRGVQQAQKESQQPEGAVNVETAKYGEELFPEDFAQYDAQRAMETAPNYLKAAEAQTTIPSHLSFLDPAKARALMGFGQKFPEMGMKAYSQFLTRKSDVVSPEREAQIIRMAKAKGPSGKMIRNVPGVGTVDFSGPTPKVLMESVGSNRLRFQNLGLYIDKEGNKIGEGTLDRNTGKRFLGTPDNPRPIPKDARPVPESYYLGSVPNFNQFSKLHGDIKDARQSLRILREYMKTRKTAKEGFSFLADKFVSNVKTLFNNSQKRYGYSPSELAGKLAKGQLQALLGQMRIEVVGGGVMTEQDAQRVLARLGGNVDMWQNKEVVAAAIRDVMKLKLKTYNQKRALYNYSVKKRFSSFPTAPEIKIDESIFNISNTSGNQTNSEGWGIRRVQ